MDGISNCFGTNLRTSICLSTRASKSYCLVNITAIALCFIILGIQMAVFVSSRTCISVLYVIFVSFTLLASILLACVAVYNLFHFRTTSRRYQDAQEILNLRIRNREVIEQELNRQLQEQRIELDYLKEESTIQFERAQHIEERYSEYMHRFEADKADLEQQLQDCREEIINLSRDLESRLSEASIQTERPSSDDEDEYNASWFEAANILESPNRESDITYMTVEEGNIDNGSSSEHEYSR
ncbi:hypothetical protein [Chlamydia felis Fe/C-56]|uniref:IncA family protein n=1 Tax=Chlamydia felis (strain Fe/C-56) TaxID=264202 RepID=Q255P7_CHLFF|nr:hypothetical protein [Chlamydia felis]BAE80991.1 hypothetical protein [Chlamydia felis Fe/C-56]